MIRAVLIIAILVAGKLYRLENQLPTANGSQTKEAPAAFAPTQPNELFKIHLFK